MSLPALPRIMVAPNGARRTQADHPALPMTVAEVVDTAEHCFRAGADGLHAHVRDAAGAHVLDAGLYKELLAEMRQRVPQMAVQITTEAVGLYAPAQQRQLVADVRPALVSVSLAEMLADDELDAARDFYHGCHAEGIAVQHILYAADELARLQQLVDDGVIPPENLQLLYVLGRYSENQQSHPDDLQPFLQQAEASSLRADWGLCAFGRGETDCLVAAQRAGGKMRIGFENGLWHSDGSLAADNAERVQALRSALDQH